MTQTDPIPCILCGHTDPHNINNDTDYICKQCQASYSATVKHAYAYYKGQLVPIGTVYKHLEEDNILIILDFQPLSNKIIIKP